MRNVNDIIRRSEPDAVKITMESDQVANFLVAKIVQKGGNYIEQRLSEM